MSFEKLSGSTRLRLNGALFVSIDASGAIRAGTSRRNVSSYGPHLLAVLDLFLKPTSVFDALASLTPRATGEHDWLDLAGTIERLYRKGLLVREDGSGAEIDTGYGFGAPPVHTRMLNDRRRSDSYVRAIRRVVEPGAVVLDLGTGSSLLASSAALAGAKSVYAIEATPMADRAREVIRASGLDSVVHVIHGWSTRVTVPEPVDVVISEIVGNDLFDEGVIDFTADALRRFARPDALTIPRQMSVLAVPLEVPARSIAEMTFSSSNAKRWSRWYGLDFSPLAQSSEARPGKAFIRPWQARSWKRLAGPHSLLEIDLQELRKETLPKLAAAVNLQIATSGLLTGILLFFSLDLGGGVTLSMAPGEVSRTSSWMSPIFLIPDGLPVRENQELLLDFSYTGGASRLTVKNRQ